MSFLKRQTTWSNTELAIVKIAVFTSGILAGYYSRNYLAAYLNPIWWVCAITCLVALYLWAVKSKRRH